jgi:RNA polymerase sigma-70 factor (ECF subfamily)
MTDSDRDLVRRAARGDREAFDALIAGRWERMYRIALRVVGEREEARDVAQSACLRLWQTLGRFRADEDLDAWIYRMVVNLSIDATRRRSARPVRPGGRRGSTDVRETAPAPAPAPEPPAPRTGPEEEVLQGELERALQELTADLPPRQKAAFVLTRIEGISANRVAEILGVAPSTVRNQVFQARSVLARRLGERFPHLLGRARPTENADEEDS